MNTTRHILAGKCVIITGANQGLGKELAKGCLAAGASVALCARDADKLRDVQEELQPLASGAQRILIGRVNIAQSAECFDFVEQAVGELGGLDILINNAGVYGPKGCIEDNDWEAWKHSLEINLFGSINMCRAVLPIMKKNKTGKIIQLSGGGATSPMPRLSAYATAKAAVVRFAETLAEEVRDSNIDVNSVAPGALNTRLLAEILEAGPEKVGNTFYARSVKQQSTGGAGFYKAVALIVFLASPASNGITGKLISAVWDPWETLPHHLDELESDIYTLRRITPKDRNQIWGNDI